MKKSKILSLILCAALVIAFASFDASAADAVQTKVALSNVYDGSVDLVKGKDGFYTESTKDGVVTVHRSAETITAGDNEEKAAGDKYYKINALTGGDYALFEAKPNEKKYNSDVFLSFDFKIDKNTTINLYTVPYWYDFETGKYASTKKSMYLGSISTNAGFTEKAAKSILGTDQNKQETFITADKIKADRWNSIQLEACGKDNTVKVHLNGVEYNIPTQTSYTDGNMTCSMTYGYNAVAIRLSMTDGASAYFDNAYMQVGVDGAPLPTDAKYATEHATNGHIGALAEHSIATFPTVTSAYDLDARNGKLPHYDINGEYTKMVDADVEHFYVKPGDTVANAVEKTVTSNNTDVSFWNEALTTKYTDTLPTTENSVALLPVLDGSGKVRMFKEVPVASGPFEYGMAVMNKVENTYYSILGFNPLLTVDEAKTLYNNKKLALTNTFDKDIWGVKHYAFYTPASEGVEEITYPDIDFDLSTVTNARLYPGMFSFSKTGITRVEFGNKEGYPQYDAFNGCEKLTYADLSGCAGGQARAFKNCVNLSEVKADDMEYWRWGTGNDTFAGCTNLKELTFDIVNTGKKTIDKDLLRGATSLEKIKIKNAAASGGKYLDNSITLYAAAYDTTGKMVGVSVLKEENSGDGFKTLNIPQGNKIKIFQFSKSGSLVPAVAATQIK